ncbi:MULTISPECIES: DUF3016 domain-containing protein [Shewanella]|jgi:hypothetical protein|uniref:DUF3016 domain-containing protein n=1 Tax=Shewanella TaxID=22 RepID=UPI000C556991|nr:MULTISPECIES: DUF3016 domain-containing protein [Shewanella]NCQ45275.1 DUF3016 domain-containing protein [Shewanella frigidimarina]NCO70737.1 DUF3016 domain-containing protein [Shewanella vesiculosa]NCP36854.1 DUF3016 domain-containing protein [Shewanella vesiculosa]NCP69053.1 DUF3016 domain-containing protein [Shewanella vesiculosa]NCP74191.1 DUF3016 domain-containing protein [Shewanella vesiculosa]
MNVKYIMLASVLVSQIVMAEDAPPPNPVTEVGLVKIEWQNPKDFSDIRTSNELQSRFENRLFDTLTKNINKEAEKTLKPGQTLQMTVTNFDLAGDMRPTFGATPGDLRVVKDLYPPRATFSYTIKEGDQVIIVGDEKITDMSFMSNSHRFNDRPFQYETTLFTDWLQKSVAPKL